jgi:putative sugar O-methyltransferase
MELSARTSSLLQTLRAQRWKRTRQVVNGLLAPLGIAVVRKSALARSAYTEPSYAASPLPPGSTAVLRRDHPRLVELRARYDAFAAMTPSQWTASFVSSEIDLQHFRGDNAYLWQLRNEGDEARYLLTAYHVREIDRLGLLDRLEEDGSFGAYCFDFNGRMLVSRDLLDSVLEIDFLDRHLGIASRPGFAVLDIGAGYGRLAYRLVTALPALGSVRCTDAVPESTFLCEYYLGFRDVAGRTEVIPLDEVERRVVGAGIDLATNIHSFSECTLASVTWWLDLLRRAEVRYLMLAAVNDGRLLTTERDGSRVDFMPAILGSGYRLATVENKYENAPSLQRFGIAPDTVHFLFERAA